MVKFKVNHEYNNGHIQYKSSLCSLRFPPLPLPERALIWIILDIGTIRFYRPTTTTFNILLTIPSCETPFFRCEDLLSPWELEFGTSQSFNCSSFIIVLT